VTKNLITLFITDDDADDREFLTHALSEKGFDGALQVFANGEELLKSIYQDGMSRQGLILLDLNMPVKNGYETLKELRQRKESEAIPVIVITSSSKTEDERYCYELGCNNFLLKPLSVAGYERLAEEIISFAEKQYSC
jgi:CheY-like chemotaxis protein